MLMCPCFQMDLVVASHVDLVVHDWCLSFEVCFWERLQLNKAALKLLWLACCMPHNWPGLGCGKQCHV